MPLVFKSGEVAMGTPGFMLPSIGEVALPERLLKLLKSVVRVIEGTREWLVALDS
jgi:hypothetical protein